MVSDPQVHERRRSERVLIRIPIKVSGPGPDGRPINETGEAVIVGRHGALLRLSKSFAIGTTLEVMNNYSTAVEKFRVVFVGEKSKDGYYDIGVEVLAPRDEFWGIRFPTKETKG